MSIIDSILGANTLYYPGCLIKAALPDVNDAYREILKRIRVDFIELEDREVCCGSPVLNTGFTKEAHKLSLQNLDLFESHSVKRIVTPCPACAYTFSQEYPKALGEKWTIKVEHMSDLLLTAVKSRRLKLKKIYKTATYHDPCYLSRYLQSTAAPRELIKLYAEKYVEMPNYGKDTFCCGGGGGVRATNPKQADTVGTARIEMALEAGAEVIENTCPMCYVQLKSHASATGGKDNINVSELSLSILEAVQK